MHKYLQVQFGQIQEITSSALRKAHMDPNMEMYRYLQTIHSGILRSGSIVI